jgi:hypothetical protein
MSASPSTLSERIQGFLRKWGPRSRRLDILALVMMTVPPLAVGTAVYHYAQIPDLLAIPLGMGALLFVLLICTLIGAKVAEIERRAIANKFLTAFPADGGEYPAALAFLAELMNSKLAAELLKQLPGGAVAMAAAGALAPGKGKSKGNSLGAQQLMQLLDKTGLMQAPGQPAAMTSWTVVSSSEQTMADLIAEQNTKTVANLPSKGAAKKNKQAKSGKAGPTVKAVQAIKSAPASTPAEPRQPACDFIPLDPYDAVEPPKQA